MAPLRARTRSPALSRFIGACCLLLALGLSSGGDLLARPLGLVTGEPQTIGEARGSTAVEAIEPLVASPAASIEAQVTAPGTGAAPADPPVAPAGQDAATSAPAVPPIANLGVTAPPPNPSLPVWAVNTRETALWAGPSGDGQFNRIPPQATFRVFDREGGRFRVYYPGDRVSRRPGEAWVDAADLAPIAWPKWVRLRRAGNVVTLPSADGAPIATLRPGTFVEVVGQAPGSWAHVFFGGDGRSGPVEGWLEAEPTIPMANPDVIPTFALSRDLMAAGGPQPWIKVPYRSQLDGTPYATSNCGPTAANMLLESFGIRVSQTDLRHEVLSLQPNEDCDDCGVYLQNLAEVVARHGLKVINLRNGNPDEFHAWTLDEVRSELRAGHPVLAQVFYRRLPVRADSPYWGDHYIVLTGMLGDRFVFNDPMDVEGPGFSRLITARGLELAMAESDFPYAAFATSR